MKKFFKNEENKIVTVAFLIVAIAVLSPVFMHYCIQGHDVSYHLLRIESLKKGILMGKPFLKVNTLFFGDMGYASSMFYPDFLLYIPALLRVAGFSIGSSYHLFIAACVMLCYLSSFYCGHKITGSKYLGSIAAILMITSQYYMDDIFVRSAVGEYTAYIFLPFVIYGLYNAVYESFSRPWIMGIGYGGVLLCHTLTFFMAVLLGAAVLLINFKRIISTKNAVFRFIITVLITMGVTASYWIPMLEQMLSARFYVSIPWTEPVEEARIFSELFGFGFPALGPLLVLLFITRLLLDKDGEEGNKIAFADGLSIGAFLFLLFTTNMIPWERIGHYLSFVQFPWRFLLICSAMLAFADMIYISCVAMRYSKSFSGMKTVRDDIGRISLIAVLLISCALIFFRTSLREEIEYYDYSNDYYDYLPYTAEVIGGEWLPVSVTDKDKLLEMCNQTRADDGKSISFERVKNSIVAEIAEGHDYVDVPFVFYKGYRAVLNTLDGNTVKAEVTNEGENGTVRVYTNGLTGTLTVEYKPTLAAYVSYVISLISIIYIVVYFACKSGLITKRK